MQTIDIEWRHLEIDKATCSRCRSTGALLRDLVAKLNRECRGRRVQVRLIETRLGPERIAESNQVLINGHRLEETGPAIEVGNSSCRSCSDLTGKAERCRTLELDGISFEVPPDYLIRSAVCRLGNCC